MRFGAPQPQPHEDEMKTHATRDDASVHVICPTWNGAAFIPEFLRSVQAQTFEDWVLWVRDDASSDGSAALVRAVAESDTRVRILASNGDRLGAVGAFRWLWEQVPSTARYLMFADQDDVWLPDKLELSMNAMRDAERLATGPVLVHTDLVVVDAMLKQVAPSFWLYARIKPETVSLPRLIVHNIVTGNTVLINRALRLRVGCIPIGAAMHDWWVACVAAALGRIVAVSVPTVLYRQHGANTIGARASTAGLALRAIPGEAARAFTRTATVRADIATAARQARAFVQAYGGALSASDRAFLHAYARIPEQRFLRRKLQLLRLHLHPENGLMRNVGLLLRA